jgi:hypothetical protein
VVKVNAEGRGIDAVGLVGDQSGLRGARLSDQLKVEDDKGKELRSTVAARWNGRPIKLGPGLTTEIEGLALALLGNCSSSSDGNRKGWKAALEGDHVLVTYSRPRVVGVVHQEKCFKDREPGELLAAEILVPIWPDALPDHVWVRYEDQYYTFAKYQIHRAQELRDLLSSFPSRDDRGK